MVGNLAEAVPGEGILAEAVPGEGILAEAVEELPFSRVASLQN